MLRADGEQLGVGRVGADAVEEDADFGLPPFQVGAEDRRLVGVGELLGPEVLDLLADPQLTFVRDAAGSSPTA